MNIDKTKLKFIISHLEDDLVDQIAIEHATTMMSSWEIFGYVFTKAKQQDWWYNFTYECLDPDYMDIPDNFFDKLHLFLYNKYLNENMVDSCNHNFYTVYKGDTPTGQRCSICGKQEWF